MTENKPLSTVADVVNALGGTSRAAAVFDVTPAAVSNWKRARQFPHRLHYRISVELDRRALLYDRAMFGVAA